MSRLFVLGNISIDVTLRVPRLPLPGETLMARGIARAPGGKGLNQAVAAARAGAEVYFAAAVGREAEMGLVHSALAGEPLAGLHLVYPGPATDLSTLIVAEDGENSIISTGDCCDAFPLAEAEAFLADMGEGDILLVQGNLTEAVTAAAVGRARRAIVNTAPVRWDMGKVLERAWVVVANEVEAEALGGELGGRVQILTRGALGCRVREGRVVTEYPAERVVAVDTTGAGDVFCGVLAAGLALGLEVGAAVGAGQRAAGLAVARPGCFDAIPEAAVLRGLLG